MQPNRDSIVVTSAPPARAPSTEGSAPDRAAAEMIDFEAVREGRKHEKRQVEKKVGIWVRIMDEVMGWLFVAGLLLWVYVLRGRAGGPGKKDSN